MNFLEIMLVEQFRDADSNLDVTGSDRKVLQVACEDVTNYLKFHWDLVGTTANQCAVVDRLEQLFKENPRELNEFLGVWTGMWLKKWKERVKLLIGEQGANKWNRASKALSNSEPLWKKLGNKQEMREIVAATLIKNGEICGTEILSENLLKMELGDKRSKDFSDRDRVFFVVNNSLRKARDMAQSRGPLIFVKVDKGYYQATT
jgi:hypothetical protein